MTERKPPEPTPPQLNTLEITSDGEIGTLTLNRPEAMNAMDPELIFELTVAAAWLADRAPFRALIVTGSGRAFSAGGDVNWFMKGLEDPEHDLPSDVRRGAEVLHQAIVDFRRIPFPVIGAVNGAAAGAGFSLALMCDLRIASEDAFFVVAYGRIGAIARRRHDLLPAQGGGTGKGAGAGAERSGHRPEERPRAGAGQRGRRRGQADGGRQRRRRPSWRRRRRTTCAWPRA